MQGSRLIECISTLNRKEIKEARKFLASPFFNQRTDVQALFELLVREERAPTKEAAFKVLFPGEAYEAQRVRQVMSWLQKLLEEYLFIRTVRAEKINRKAELVQVFRTRGLDRHFGIAVREAEALLEESPYRSADWHQKSYRLLQEKHRQTGKRQRTGEQHLQALTEEHDAFYLIEKLRHACLIRSYQAVNKVDYSLGLLLPLLPQLSDDFWEKWPAAAIYFFSFKMLSEPEGHSFFHRLKAQLEKHRHLFPPEELRDIYLFAINFSIRQFNEEKRDYAREAFQLYRDMLAAQLLTLEGHISRFAYRNIVALGLHLQEYEWVEHFLMEQKAFLEVQHREATFSFNLARLEYERKNFAAAILLLQKADYSDILLNLAAKNLLIKIYLLLDEQRLLDSHLRAMRRFVERKKMVGYHRENYLNIISISKKLIELNPFDKAAKASLQKLIESTEPLTERKWLLEQLAKI
ncbi:MAG: hypothetical protein AAGG75_11920 [Bacteroidota bacterium]